jgi:riboflavin kinase / FMN adenylyltransferase
MKRTESQFRISCTYSTKESTLRTAVTIGNFDAVHLGHVALVARAREAVGKNGIVEVWSFDPSPVTILNPTFYLERLTSFGLREKLLLGAGADKVRKIIPTQALLAQTPEEFITDVVNEVAPDYFVEGTQFVFGKGRAGTAETLRELGKELGFSLIELDGVEVTLADGEPIRASSSRVRSLLKEGRVEEANSMLGRDYEVSGVVSKGDQRGRTLGIPTANLSDVTAMLPKDGIYAGTTIVDGERYIVAISVGTKPTFGENARVLEAHIISYDGDLEHYNWPLTVTISHWIRDQKRFDSVAGLREQIEADITVAITLIESAK